LAPSQPPKKLPIIPTIMLSMIPTPPPQITRPAIYPATAPKRNHTKRFSSDLFN
jgi:hypothetical protein